MKNIGMDLCCFERTHKGGKDEVAYNLLRGFQENGVAGRIVCFCHEELSDIIRGLSEDVQICVVPKYNTGHRTFDRLQRGRFIKKQLVKRNIGCLLFGNKLTPTMIFPVPTWVIPHDIQVFTRGREYWPRSSTRRLEKTLITLDMILRSRIISISQYDREQMLKYFPWCRRKIVQIYNPIRFEEPVSASNEKKYITAINIQHKHKNTETLIKAYALIRDRIPYRLMLVGRMNVKYENAFLNLIEELGLKEDVILPGFVSKEELNEIVESTRMYVNPSLFEGFGMTSVEMMGRKVPVIAAENSAVPEVTMGLCRYYKNAVDEKELAGVMMEEIENPMDQEALDSICLKVRERYSYRNIAQRYWELLNGIERENR